MKRYIAFGLLAVFVLTICRFALAGYSSVHFNELAAYDQILVVAGVVGAFGFWFMMLFDFFNNNELGHKALWGFCLLFLSWIASIIYFVKYFLPRSRI